MDPVWIKEQLAKTILKFELHDKDKINRSEIKESLKLIEIGDQTQA